MTTRVLIITDQSGSMAGLAEDVRGGHNAYLDSLAGEDILLTHIVFNTTVTYLDRAVPLANATRLDADNYRPMGGTALLDAVGDALSELVVPEGDRALVFIQTDGHENSSKEYSLATVRKLIEGAEARGVAVVYAAAGADAWSARDSYGSGSVLRTNSGAGTRDAYNAYAWGTRSFAGGQSNNSGEVAAVVVENLPTESVKSDETGPVR